MAKERINLHIVVLFLFSLHLILIFFNGDSFFNLGNSFIIYAIIILVLIIQCIIKREFKYRRGDWKKIFMLFYLIFSIEIVNRDYQESMLKVMLLTFTLLLAWNLFDFDVRQVNYLITGYIISAIILATILLLQRYQPYISINGSNRMTILSSNGVYYDVNFLSAYLVLADIFLFINILDKKRKKLSVVFFTIITCALVLASSRAALGILILAILGILFFQKKLTVNTVIYMCIFCIIALGIYMLLPDSVTSHLSRGISLSADITRMRDWQYGIKLISENPIFGNGIVSTKNLIIEKYGITWITVHNTYLSFFVYYGLVGGIVVLLIMLEPLRKMIKNKIRIEYIIVYAGYLILILMIEANFSDIWLIPILLFTAISKLEGKTSIDIK